MSFNKITVVGYLGRDPELRYTPQGTAVCNFTVATNDRRRDKSGEMQDITTWFRINLWNKQAETAQKYLRKGSQVYVEGRLRIDEWTDRDGKTRFTLDVQGSDIQFIGSRGGDESSGDSDNYERSEAAPASTGGNSAPQAEYSGSDDDIPF